MKTGGRRWRGAARCANNLLGCTIVLDQMKGGGAGGEAASHCVSEIDERKWEEGICP